MALICPSISLAVDKLLSKELQNRRSNHSAIKNDSFSEDTLNALELYYRYSFCNLINKYFDWIKSGFSFFSHG